MMNRQIVSVVLSLAVLAAGQSAWGVWSDDFNGSFDQSWTIVNQDSGGNPSGTFSSSIASNYLSLSDSTAIGSGGAVSAFGLVLAESFTDMTITGTLNPAAGTDNDLGLLGRINAGTASGYSLFVDFNAGTLDITRLDLGVPTDLTLGANITGFNSSSSYFAELSISGSSLSARVLDTAGGTVLASLSTSDTTYTSGVAGVATSVQGLSGTETLSGSFDDINAAPEPASLALMAIGAVALLRRRR